MYKYENPLDKGMIKLKISKSQLEQNGMAKYGHKLFSKVDVYVGEEYGIIENRTNIFGKVVMVLLFPVHVLLVGVIKAYNETLHTLFENKYGSFSSGKVYRDSSRTLSKFIYSVYDVNKGSIK